MVQFLSSKSNSVGLLLLHVFADSYTKKLNPNFHCGSWSCIFLQRQAFFFILDFSNMGFNLS